MDKEVEEIQKTMQTELDAYKATQKGKFLVLNNYFNESMEIIILDIDFQKLIHQRQLLDGQLSENKSVQEELNLLNESNKV